MFPRVLALALLLPVAASAITVEIVKLYQPLSLHNTDGVGEEVEGEEPLQAGVYSRPMAISGAMPEDLVKAVGQPHKIASNSPAYEVADANLLTLCKVGLTVEMKSNKLLVRLDISKLTIPEEIDLTSRQVLGLSIKAIRETLKDYFKHLEGVEEEEALEVSVGVVGTNEGNASLKDLAVRFKAGE